MRSGATAKWRDLPVSRDEVGRAQAGAPAVRAGPPVSVETFRPAETKHAPRVRSFRGMRSFHVVAAAAAYTQPGGKSGGAGVAEGSPSATRFSGPPTRGGTSLLIRVRRLLLLLFIPLAESGRDVTRAAPAAERGRQRARPAPEAGESLALVAEAGSARRLRVAQHLGQFLHRLRRLLGGGGRLLRVVRDGHEPGLARVAAPALALRVLLRLGL